MFARSSSRIPGVLLERQLQRRLLCGNGDREWGSKIFNKFLKRPTRAEIDACVIVYGARAICFAEYHLDGFRNDFTMGNPGPQVYGAWNNELLFKRRQQQQQSQHN